MTKGDVQNRAGGAAGRGVLRSRLASATPARVLVVRALQLGDMLCSVPALRALRTALPDARIVLLGLPWAQSFVARFSRYLDGFIELPGYPGLAEQPPEIYRVPELLEIIQGSRFDVAIQMHGSGEVSNPLTALLGAAHMAGFYRAGSYCPDQETFLQWRDGEHEVLRLIRLMEFSGFPAQGEHLEFPLMETDHRELEAIAEARELVSGEFVCVHPGARAEARRWSAAHFAKVADAIAAEGFRIVITGSLAEAELARAVAQAMRAPSLNLACHRGFSLGALAALVSRARLVVCNDTGVAHLAAALRVPSVVVFTTSDPGRWAPLDRSLHHVVAAPARLHEAGRDASGASGPSVDTVIASVLNLLGKDTAQAA